MKDLLTCAALFALLTLFFFSCGDHHKYKFISDGPPVESTCPETTAPTIADLPIENSCPAVDDLLFDLCPDSTHINIHIHKGEIKILCLEGN